MELIFFRTVYATILCSAMGCLKLNLVGLVQAKVLELYVFILYRFIIILCVERQFICTE